ncbi:hypothetical protein N2152v2_003970 [Parachlorella kessleri]
MGRMHGVLALLCVFLAAAGTSAQDNTATANANAVATSGTLTAAAAFLNPLEEVPPVVAATTATFIATLNAAGDAWAWKIVAKMGAFGTNGPVAVQLIPDNQQTPMLATPVTTDTVTFQGTITAGILKGPLANMPLTALTALFKSGNAYVSSGLPCMSAAESSSSSSSSSSACCGCFIEPTWIPQPSTAPWQ